MLFLLLRDWVFKGMSYETSLLERFTRLVVLDRSVTISNRAAITTADISSNARSNTNSYIVSVAYSVSCSHSRFATQTQHRWSTVHVDWCQLKKNVTKKCSIFRLFLDSLLFFLKCPEDLRETWNFRKKSTPFEASGFRPHTRFSRPCDVWCRIFGFYAIDLVQA